MNPPHHEAVSHLRTPKNGTTQRNVPRKRIVKKCQAPQIYVSNYINRDGFVGQVMCRGNGEPIPYVDNQNENVNATLNVVYRVPTALPLIPPTPRNNNNNNNNNNINHNNNRRSHWKNDRCNSPHSTESDDSCRSFISHGDTPQNIGLNNRKLKSKVHYENALVSKFSNSTPSIFPQSIPAIPNGHFKPKYYTNSTNQPLHRHDTKKRYHPADINRRVYGLMERFSSKARLFRIPPYPRDWSSYHDYDILNQSMWDVYQAKAQKEQTYLRKLDLWKKVYLSIQKVLDRYGLFLVGSTMSGLGLDTSDIDMCLLVRPFAQDPYTDALNYLQNICNMLKTCDYVKSAEIIMAKVPILKFCDNTYGFEVDLNCNNSVGIRNTHLLNCYSRVDWRVRPLVAIVKLWAQENGINDAKEKTISSYSIALMVIHFLQCGVSPPAIPCLQAMYPEKFRPDLEIHKIDIQEDMPPYNSSNRQSLGELLLGFLQYYTFFDYSQFAISVREASILLKEECRFIRSPKNDATQWKLLCIEEPFDLTNTARSVYDVDVFEHIKNVFHVSYEALLASKNLSSILPNGGCQR